MIQIYADGVLVCDSRVESHALTELKVTTGINVGGTANITMQAGHPAFDVFTPYKTIVTIYRDGQLRFRGRPLYPVDAFQGSRTIVCEGELCFLRDSISRPYSETATPRSWFVTLVNAHNAQVDATKQFQVGTVTVTEIDDDGTTEVTLESDSAETVLDTMNKLVDRCGGRIYFNSDSEGNRLINWAASDVYSHNSQTIELGENLLTFSSTGANTKNLATGIIPYGARNETTKKRLTIEKATPGGETYGLDYLLDEEAVAAYGVIMTTKTWDDVTSPTKLYKLAEAYLAESRLFITSLTVTALDLSYIDKDIQHFNVGEQVRVVSKPHRVDADFQLTQMVEDMLSPDKSKITLGRDVLSLSRALTSGSFDMSNQLDSVQGQVNAGQDLSNYVTSDQLSGYVTQDALEVYATVEGLAQETAARKEVIDLVDDMTSVGSAGRGTNILGQEVNIGDDEHVTHIYGGDRVKVHNRMHLIGSMMDFDNEQGVRIYNNDGNVYYIMRVDANNNTFLGTDTNNLYLRGPAVYLKSSGATVSSDERNKHSIEELPQAYVDMLDKLTPVRFKYKDGTSDRFHVGFIAQDVERALTEAGLTSQDFGGFVDLDGDGKTLGLAYDEFIGLLYQKIRGLEKRLKELEG